MLSKASVPSGSTDKQLTPVEKRTTMYTSVSQRMASAYKKVGVESRVESASPHELINMLFDGLLETLSAAKIHMQNRDIEAKGNAIRKATRILSEGLKSSLDTRGGELTKNLQILYDYCVSQLLKAHLKNDPLLIDEVIGLIRPVADTWKNMSPVAQQ